MAREKARNPVKKETALVEGGERVSMRFRQIRTRRLLTVEMDRSDGNFESELDWNGQPSEVQLEGSLIKMRILYPEGMEEQARKFFELVRKASPESEFRNPEFVAIRKQSKQRVAGLDDTVDPEDAVRLWLGSRPIRHVDPKEVERTIAREIRALGKQAARVQAVRCVLRRIEAEDFLSFRGKQRIDFGDNPEGVFGVCGRYAGEEGRSNRSGKSAFLEVFPFAVYGEARDAKVLDSYIHNTGAAEAARATVRMDLQRSPQCQAKACEFERARFPGKTSFCIDGAKVSLKKGEDPPAVTLLGLSFKDFVRTAFIRQNDLLGILADRSGEIKADLFRWLGLDFWSDVASRIGKLEQSVQEELSKLRSRMQVHREDAATSVPTNEEVERQTEVVERWAAKCASKDTAVYVRELRRKLEDLGEFEKWNAILQEDCPTESEMKSEEAVLSKLESEFEEIKQVLAVKRKEVQAASQLIGGGFSGMCPVDSASCPRADEIRGNEELHRSKLRGLEKQQARMEKTRDELTDAVLRARETFDYGLGVIRDHKAAQDAVLRLAPKVAGLVRTKLEKEILELSESQTDSERNRQQHKREMETLASMMMRIKRHEAAVASLESGQGEEKELEGRLAVVRYARMVCGPSGIPSVQVERAALTIESQANEILTMMGQGYRIEFRFETELQDMEKSCHACGNPYPPGNAKGKCPVCGEERQQAMRDEFSVHVREHGGTHELDLDSGGGKDLQALAVRIALAKFLGCTILFMDEVCASLDSRNLRSMIGMLTRLPELGFRQVFVISHRPEVAEALPRNILVTRHDDEGWSEVGWQG